MSTLSSERGQRRSASGLQQERVTATSPVTLSEGGLLIVALVRIFVGFLWFQQLFWKLPPTFGGLRSNVVNEAKHTILPGYAFIIQHVYLPNFPLLGTFVFTAESLVALCLLFGIFSRFGGILAALLSIQLYVGLSTVDWYWTYGMLVLLGAIFAVIPAGRRLGVDQWLAPRLWAASDTNRFARFLSWFV